MLEFLNFLNFLNVSDGYAAEKVKMDFSGDVAIAGSILPEQATKSGIALKH